MQRDQPANLGVVGDALARMMRLATIVDKPAQPKAGSTTTRIRSSATKPPMRAVTAKRRAANKAAAKSRRRNR